MKELTLLLMNMCIALCLLQDLLMFLLMFRIHSYPRLCIVVFNNFLLLAPGKKLSMEKAPWKLTAEMVDVMGGLRSAYFEDYVSRCTAALKEARRHAEAVCVLMEIMSYKSNYPALRYNAAAIQDFRGRLLLSVSDSELRREVDHLISRSYCHTGTGMYDRFQLQTNGIVI